MARSDKFRVEDSDKLEGIERPFGRLMAYVFHHYPVRISLTVVCIITAAVASAVGSIFMQQIVDNVVTPGLESGFDAVRGTLVRLHPRYGDRDAGDAQAHARRYVRLHGAPAPALL